jgi:SAM-dependent methyltransferase
MTHIENKTNQPLNYFDLIAAKVAYRDGHNVTDLLRNQKGVAHNTPEIIETAYDLQAGAYIARTKVNLEAVSAYAEELALCLSSHISNTTTLLDIGCGELTTLSLTLARLPVKPKRLFAFDISWSRVFLGCSFADDVLLKEDRQRLQPFVADINEIPVSDKSVDVTTSSHALEPNGNNLRSLLLELFRVTRHRLVLFEPCYEINTEDGKARMDNLGYIKNIEGVVSELGGRLIDKIRITNSNPLNPTVCFVIEPPVTKNLTKNTERFNHVFSVPGTNLPISKTDGYYFSKETGLCFPILKDIPILKTNSAILASALVI